MTHRSPLGVPDWSVEWLSEPRIRRYVRACGPRYALELYRWNSELSTAAFELIGWFEVAWRNAVDRSISARRRGRQHWLFDRAFPLQPRSRAKVAKALATIRESGMPHPTPDQVIAELTLGFWRFTTRGYEKTMWGQYLSWMFPHAPGRPQRDDIDHMLRAITLLRNRIAHHEPIFARPDVIADRVADMLRIGGWINPGIAEWWRANASIIGVLNHRP